ncbi:ABC transporter permease [Steroidobacter flavus]|uniref:Transport permease protein n=1 Tax=Steroidobacter flavus TaxID=1842136 RepID=A0ABV8SL20_9GAMM
MRWIGFKTLVRRECGVIVRFWIVTLAPPAVMTALYVTIFGGVVGQQIDGWHGVDYIHYLSPGLILLWVIPYSFAHTAAGLLGARSFRFIEEILVTPLPNWVVMMGYVAGGMVRGLLVGLVATIATLLFTQLSIHSVFVSVSVLSLAALVASAGGFITALFAKTFEQVNLIQGSVLTPLTYLGGVFVSISTMPDWAQALSVANPMFYMVDAFRYGFLGVSDGPAGTALAIILALGVVLMFAAMKIMARGIGIRE